MARYIDAEKMPHGEFWNGLTDKEKQKVLSWMQQAPTAEVEPVVHCKDCIYYGDVTYGYVCRRFSAINTKICMKPNDYCSEGKST